MIAIFARPNHPNYDNGEWRHHGYVVVLVRCVDYKQALEVKAKLVTEGLPEPYKGHESYEQGWYGGRMDMVAVTEGWSLSDMSHMVSAPITEHRTKQSVGDNRFVGFYDAGEILNSQR